MSSRDKILSIVKQNQPQQVSLPVLQNFEQHNEKSVEKYKTVLQFIGAEVIEVNDYDQIAEIIRERYTNSERIVSTCPELQGITENLPEVLDPHVLADVELFITTSTLAVAENGSVWVKDDQLPHRALPFVSQQLAVIITRESIVATMHDAYDLIGGMDYSYATFIAGPSKTADIAQSLVLGAHGPKTMTVFILKD